MLSPQLTDTIQINKRARKLNQVEIVHSPVIYWMSRDQRVQDNWALTLAAQQAHATNQPFWVVFNLVDSFLGANLRHFDFMLNGLAEVSTELKDLNINFKLLIGEPVDTISKFASEISAKLIVCDFSPLKVGRKWRSELADKATGLGISVSEVDAHNIVPVWIASDKQEFAARTIRPKINRLLPQFLTDFPKIPDFQSYSKANIDEIDVDKLLTLLKVDTSVPKVSWLKPGSPAAVDTLQKFIKNISEYAELKNDPNQPKLSNLSPYLHFGQISAQRIALEIQKLPNELDADKASFLEELIIRKELADNFCNYNSNYDLVSGFADWAKKTLDLHRADTREHLYTLEQLEHAQTQDELWNASQLQMVIEGKMHGYMRMYWAKKLLEWTESPEQAMEYAIFLNDKYELDGRDPNGYTGIAWSIGGIHDRPWFDRPIFGSVRYMNAAGAARKFNTQAYIQKYVQN